MRNDSTGGISWKALVAEEITKNRGWNWSRTPRKQLLKVFKRILWTCIVRSSSEIPWWVSFANYCGITQGLFYSCSCRISFGFGDSARSLLGISQRLFSRNFSKIFSGYFSRSFFLVILLKFLLKISPVPAADLSSISFLLSTSPGVPFWDTSKSCFRGFL